MKYLLISLLLILGFRSLTGQDTAGRLVWEYYNNREYEKAAPLFLKMYEENAIKTYLNYYVNCLVELKETETAVKAVRKAIRTTKDVTLYIDLGFIYENEGDTKKADECYQEPLKEFPQSMAGITNLGNTYLSYLKAYYAETVYELGRKVLGDPDAFRMEMANVYFGQRKFQSMLDEYMALLLREPQYLPSVESLIQNALTYDVDKTLLQLTREKTLIQIQQLPGISVYYEMLIWVLTEERKFGEAVEQSIAMDRRSRSTPEKMLQIARIAAEAGDFGASLLAYEYMINKGPDAKVAASPGRMVSVSTYYRTARIESLLIRSEKLRAERITDRNSWQTLAGEFRKTMEEYLKAPETGPLYLDLTRIAAEELDDPAQALAIIESALALPGNAPGFRTDCLLLKGDILLASDDPWEASFVFAMIDIENPDNPAGSEARLRRARMSWFTGDFKLAAAQLDVLKGSTSKPVANDAFELSLLIRENRSDTDSTQATLTALAGIDYLCFRKKYAGALHMADSVLAVSDPEEPSRDDILYKKALIFEATGQIDQLVAILNDLLDKFRYDYWGHKALYDLGCLYQDYFKDNEKAALLFEDFIRDFPNSFYFLDVRDRLKTLKSTHT